MKATFPSPSHAIHSLTIFNKIHSPLNNASFVTFCIPIGQLFKSDLVFEGSVKSDVLTLLNRNDANKNLLGNAKTQGESSD